MRVPERSVDLPIVRGAVPGSKERTVSEPLVAPRVIREFREADFVDVRGEPTSVAVLARSVPGFLIFASGFASALMLLAGVLGVPAAVTWGRAHSPAVAELMAPRVIVVPQLRALQASAPEDESGDAAAVAAAPVAVAHAPVIARPTPVVRSVARPVVKPVAKLAARPARVATRPVSSARVIHSRGGNRAVDLDRNIALQTADGRTIVGRLLSIDGGFVVAKTGSGETRVAEADVIDAATY